MTGQRYADPAQVPADLGTGRKIERILIVLPGYAADPTGRTVGEGGLACRACGGLWRLLTTASYRRFVRGHRDFYANARPMDYMATRLAELADRALGDPSIVLVAVDMPSIPAPLAGRAGRIDLVAVPGLAGLGCLADLLANQDPFDAVLLAHHDALGLGLRAVERTVLAHCPDRTFVINGRRRVYRLDRDMQGRLAVRRLRAETRMVELAASFLLRPWSCFPDRSGKAAGQS